MSIYQREEWRVHLWKGRLRVYVHQSLAHLGLSVKQNRYRALVKERGRRCPGTIQKMSTDPMKCFCALCGRQARYPESGSDWHFPPTKITADRPSVTAQDRFDRRESLNREIAALKARIRHLEKELEKEWPLA